MDFLLFFDWDSVDKPWLGSFMDNLATGMQGVFGSVQGDYEDI